MGAQLTTKIPVKDRDGNTIGEKEVATYAGLLARAHDEGLRSTTTRLLQVPGEDNGHTAIVEATVEASKGSFAGLGDASPQNVNRRVAAHLIRMAETRAKARALRDAVNIGMVAMEELGGDEELDATPAPAPAPGRPHLPPSKVRPFPQPAERRAPPVPEGRHAGPARDSEVFPGGNTRAAPVAMTENQRRLLYRMLAHQGLEGHAATDALLAAAEVSDIRAITKADASQLIDLWKADTDRDAQAGGGSRAS